MNLNGLNEKQVIESREKYGSNKLPEPKLKSKFRMFIETYNDPINKILIVMLLLFLVMAVFQIGSFTEPVGIGAVLLALGVIGVSSNSKVQKSAKELHDKTSIHFCNVIRNGKIEHINTNDIVVGDVVILQSGEGIFADGFLVEGNLKVNNAVLNGESEDCKKKSWTKENAPFEPGSRTITSNDYVDEYSLFSGAVVTEGEGKMIVTEVGINTENGKTITSLGEIEEQKTSLELQLDTLAKQISIVGYVGAVIIMGVLLGTHIFSEGLSAFVSQGAMNLMRDVLLIVANALTIIVAAVPEGLPLIIQIITAQNARRMLKNNILAKHTNKIPEAGNIQLLCTDKTGTLTKGVLTPVYNIGGNGNKIVSGKCAQVFKNNIILNTSAMYDDNQEIVGGNATERALLSMVNASEFKEVSAETTVRNKLPFNSSNKYSAVECDGITYYKGAPEKLLTAKKYLLSDGTEEELDHDFINQKIKEYTGKAMRVIATAYSHKPIPESGLPDDLVLISLIAIRDDVREEVPAAVKRMHEAGVQVMMVTGDVLETAKAIAKDSGLYTNEEDIAMSAIDFDKLSDEEAKEKLPYIKVIARATPSTKLRIIKLAQELKLCVGMTGDGTNDSPALKAADVGFSMGSGTDVCKEAGDIIITDDNFVSITNAVMYGRTFMHNTLKFLKFQLPINLSLVLLSIIFPIILGVEAMAAVQILLINIVMDGLNSLSFGGEPPKDEYMKEKPILKGSKLLSKETSSQIAVSTIGFLFIFGLTLIPAIRNIFPAEIEYAAARFAILIIMAVINGFNIRTDSMNLFKGITKNPMFVKVAIGIFVGVFLIAQFGGAWVHCTALTLVQWLVIAGLSLLIVPIDLGRKFILKNKGGK